jgi:hypothetical protein
MTRNGRHRRASLPMPLAAPSRPGRAQQRRVQVLGLVALCGLATGATGAVIAVGSAELNLSPVSLGAPEPVTTGLPGIPGVAAPLSPRPSPRLGPGRSIDHGVPSPESGRTPPPPGRAPVFRWPSDIARLPFPADPRPTPTTDPRGLVAHPSPAPGPAFRTQRLTGWTLGRTAESEESTDSGTDDSARSNTDEPVTDRSDRSRPGAWRAASWQPGAWRPGARGSGVWLPGASRPGASRPGDGARQDGDSQPSWRRGWTRGESVGRPSDASIPSRSAPAANPPSATPGPRPPAQTLAAGSLAPVRPVTMGPPPEIAPVTLPTRLIPVDQLPPLLPR